MLEMLSEQEVVELYELSAIVRYNHRLRIRNESVAEHSFFASIFALKLLNQSCFARFNNSFKYKVLAATLIHDTSEVVVSDTPHDVKVSFEQMRLALASAEQKFNAEKWTFVEVDNELIRAIVKLADAYSVLQYCLSELSLGNVSEKFKIIRADAEYRIELYTSAINNLLKEGKSEHANWV